jgi:hypothetical protein
MQPQQPQPQHLQQQPQRKQASQPLPLLPRWQTEARPLVLLLQTAAC